MHLLYFSLKGDTWTIRADVRAGMLGECSSRTAAVAKCVAPGGATHEQVDVAAARKEKQKKRGCVKKTTTRARH